MKFNFLIALILTSNSVYALEWYQTEFSHHTIERLTNEVDVSNHKSLSICESYGCQKQVDIKLTAKDFQILDDFFKPVFKDPGNERLAISQAIALLENFAGHQSAIYKDKGKNSYDSHSRGYLDCIAESINTLTWLKILETRNLLQLHTVGEPIYRKGIWSSQHWAVAIKEKNTGHYYVVDSWYRDNGLPAVIQSLQNWNREKSIPGVLSKND